ncbi:PKD domain-containing protein [Vibrio splendidus]|uniref:PKD domain-containing protein n=2 Tax=Vibrio splendidus TaxID=29497 RepID=A0A2T5EDH1_VIBSP|nr:PKD domain-containing protein [Vibrio splendidus FF-6]PTP17370.1 PKD domain-containing protein [Vibrio splendidus]
MHINFHWAPILLFAALSTGCNSGGDSNTPSTDPGLQNNQRPIAIAGINQQVKEGDRVQLDGTSSIDYDKDEITYQWSLSSTPLQSLAELSQVDAIKPTFIADKLGTYVVDLVVHDGTTSSRTNQVKVVAVSDGENSPPTVSISRDHYRANLIDFVTIFGKASDADDDDDELIYRWKIIQQPENSNPSLDNTSSKYPRLTTDTIGDYIVELTVSDGLASASDTATVSFYYENVPPIVRGTGSPIGAIEGMTIPLDASTSEDPNGDPITFQWSFISKPQASNTVIVNPSSAKPHFLADVAGDYGITVEVSDGELSSFPSKAAYVRVASLTGPHAKVMIDDDPNPVLLPYRNTWTIDKTQDSGDLPDYYELGTYTFEAVTNDITLTVSTLRDRSNTVQPIARTPFGDLKEREIYVIPAGTKEVITILSPPTSGQTTDIDLDFAWSLYGLGDYSPIRRAGGNYIFTSR